MIKTDEDALVCDFVEVYGKPYREYPLSLAATLACGLGENSRIVRRLSGCKFSNDTLLLALIFDKLAILQWFQTEDGQKGENQPESLYQKLVGTNGKKGKTNGYDNEKDFAAAYKKFVKGGTT